jgi:acetyltransferase-like isoleucine patch superfamily enzyme
MFDQIKTYLGNARYFARGRPPRFLSDDVLIGEGCSIGSGCIFRCKTVRIGDGAWIRDDVLVEADYFEVGDFATIYQGAFFPGGTVKAGHNFWAGAGSIIDGRGGMTIGSNVCVGAQSQLWTHMIFGDAVFGCRFRSEKPMDIADDVWFSGRCFVAPVRAGPRSLALAGAVVTRDMEADRVYAGVPAEDATEKFGAQFRPTTIEERIAVLAPRLDAFAKLNGFASHQQICAVVDSEAGLASASDEKIAINVGDRTYRKKGTALERRLMRFLLPEAKFVPSR